MTGPAGRLAPEGDRDGDGERDRDDSDDDREASEEDFFLQTSFSLLDLWHRDWR